MGPICCGEARDKNKGNMTIEEWEAIIQLQDNDKRN